MDRDDFTRTIIVAAVSGFLIGSAATMALSRRSVSAQECFTAGSQITINDERHVVVDCASEPHSTMIQICAYSPPRK